VKLWKTGGWRWWTRGGFMYVSLATDVNWFHIEVGPVDVTVGRRRCDGGDE
jgi:hypothetical protein